MAFDKLEHLELHLALYYKLKITDLKRLKSLHIQSTNMPLELDAPNLVHLSLCQEPSRLSNRLRNVEQLRTLHCDQFRDWMRELHGLEELAIQKLGDQMIPNLFVDLVKLKKLNISAISSSGPLKDLFRQSKNSNCRLHCKGLKMDWRFVNNLDQETDSGIDPLSLADPALDVDLLLLAQDFEFDSCLPSITKAVCLELVLDGLSDLLQRLPNLCSLVLNGPELSGDFECKFKALFQKIGLRVRCVEIDCQVNQSFLDDLPVVCPNLARFSFSATHNLPAVCMNWRRLHYTAADRQVKCLKFVALFRSLKNLYIHRRHLELDTLKCIIINCKYLNFIHITKDTMRYFLTKNDEIIIHNDKFKHQSTCSKSKFCNQMF